MDHEAAQSTKTPEPVSVMDFIVEPTDEMYWVSSNTLNVRPTYSTDQQPIGYLTKGDYIQVTGIVMYDGADYGWRRINFGELAVRDRGEGSGGDHCDESGDRDGSGTGAVLREHAQAQERPRLHGCRTGTGRRVSR